VSTTFPRTRGSKRGYSVDQVEDFLEEARRAYSTDPALPGVITSDSIRETAFALEKGGYSPSHVDAALERLEDAFAMRERDRSLASPGADAEWYAQARSTAQVILDRLDRPAGDKFARAGFLTPGYARKDVDAFCDRLVDYFQNGTVMSIEEVRTIAFPSARNGYREQQVDHVLDTVVKVMLAVR
jgi:DivIVA domain-containing protein